VSSHRAVTIEGLEGISASELRGIAELTEQECTISKAIRESVAITHDVSAI
jgi:organic hydroperoxide reductase OsmC/OhrA